MEPPSKRTKLSAGTDSESDTPLVSLHREISPPVRAQPSPLKPASPGPKGQDDLVVPKVTKSVPKVISSPVQLTNIRDLPANNNVDTVRLRDILGDPMIRECWQFNYLFDVDFLMSNFDEDVRSLVKVKVVHGSWQKEAPNRIRVEEACSRFSNVEQIVAYMPEPFGTHHSKMMILLRHDDLAQVIIHTANMIPGDWTNMTQAVWHSPLLPLERKPSPEIQAEPAGRGSGARFKRDILAYLKAYGPSKTGPLTKQLADFDFQAVRAALVASVPSRQHASDSNSDEETLWGWLALKDLMSNVPTSKHEYASPHIVVQISSVATLGQTDKWLKDVFFKALAPESTPRNSLKYSIIFPTPDEIRRSLDGYGSGGSIHMKTQSAAQQKQLQYMRPHLCQWAGDGLAPGAHIDLSEEQTTREAGRRRAAPHIKTYIRFSGEDMKKIEWTMVSSANLSTQAWGAATNANGEVRICSWEIGVAVWPDLFKEDGDDESSQSQPSDAAIVPCFKQDTPQPSEDEKGTVVGFRMPYDLPLTPYAASDEPWCATATYDLPDWRGQRWI
ncbi:hypothetical protein N7541_003931 [Penicillium brevicompactum]|uniref:Tyrosyl-DNA phosphodiesterase n=1 Tax=Penicillium brevicompactum TaxID=5074 RepID=A0A9W9UZC4_PENBR|nr:hypothetical protein N7541_003931 [Penicillium brevicompactum]